jgi:hypothetical protein
MIYNMRYFIQYYPCHLQRDFEVEVGESGFGDKEKRRDGESGENEEFGFVGFHKFWVY